LAGAAEALKRAWCAARDSFDAYTREPMAFTGASLAMLYLTVMSFGNIMTGYLRAIGASQVDIAAFRGVGALAGLLASVLYPVLHTRWALGSIAQAAVWWQWSCVAVAAVACMPMVPLAEHARFYLLVSFVVLSRFGLWCFDMAANQLIQEGVHREEFGRFNTVQESLQMAFEMLAYAATLVLADTSRFWVLAVISTSATGAAALNFSCCARRPPVATDSRAYEELEPENAGGAEA